MAPSPSAAPSGSGAVPVIPAHVAELTLVELVVGRFLDLGIPEISVDVSVLDVSGSGGLADTDEHGQEDHSEDMSCLH